MKNKKNYLKIAIILEVIYSIFMLIYYMKNLNKNMITMLFIMINLCFVLALFLLIKKDIEYIKSKKIFIIICSITFLFNSFLSGIFVFIFLLSISDKKKECLPDIKLADKKIFDYIKSILILLIFILTYILFPRLSFFNKMPSLFIYFSYIILIILFNIKEIYDNFLIFIKNFLIYIKYIFKRYGIMLLVMIVVTLPVYFITNGKTSPNQIMVEDMFKSFPIVTALLSCLYAPFVEESIFRLNLSKLFNNKDLFIVISGILFGSLHVIDKITDIYSILYVFQYVVIGICLSKAYADSKNIWVPIMMHMLQNTLSVIIMMFVLY